MDKKIYRHICRTIKDKLEKKFHNITIALPFSFSDKTDFEKILFLIYVDGNSKDMKQINEFMKSFADLDSFNKYSLNSFIYKHSDSENIKIEYKFFDSIDELDYNHYLYSYDIFNFLLNKIVEAYNCKINEKGLFSNNILISNNMEEILKLFGYKVDRFSKPFTKKQFFEYMVGSIHFCPIKIPFECGRNSIEDEVIKFVEEHRNLFIQNPNIQLLNEIEKYTNPTNAIERLKDNIKKRSSNLYVSLLNVYINKSINTNFSKLENQYKNYLNSILECYNIIFKNEKQYIDNIKIEKYQNRISQIETDIKMFYLIDNETNFTLLFKTQIDINMKELNIYPIVDTDKVEINETANKLINFLIDDMGVDFNFTIKDEDIQTILFHNYTKERERLREVN